LTNSQHLYRPEIHPSVTTCPGDPSMAATEEKSANMFTCAMSKRDESTGISKKFQIGSKRKRILKFPKIKIKSVEDQKN
jgi:hypothetical protein